MPSFQSHFSQSRGKPIVYNGRTLQLIDEFPLHDSKSTCLITRESTNSEWRQGISLSTSSGKILVNDAAFKHIQLWENTAPEQVKISVVSAARILIVKNIWEMPDHRGVRAVHAGHHGAAMEVEVLPSGRRYQCNDGHPDEDFDDIIFRIEEVIR
jgi:hypothetical protein